ncbi:hypothetical protein [Streptomyces sp. NPDC006668]|uniref:hypothetical protein n=1 Tax=Streptomyces sp. NPDC006668 TaxID=3156903 RepID=UPI0033ED1E3F
MVSPSNFGALLTRLINHRRMAVVRLSLESGVPVTELRSMMTGTPPRAPQLTALAPALGLHTADLFVIADFPRTAPAPLTSRDRGVGAAIVDVVRVLMALPPEQTAHINRLVDQMPLESEDSPLASPFIYDQREAGFGAVLGNLLCGNRNLRSVSVAAKVLAVMTDGGLYLAASTISGIGRGRVPVTPGVVTGFATALGIPGGSLAAMAGVELGKPSRPDDPAVAERAELLWKCRRLTKAQVEYVRGEAESMLVAVPQDAPGEDWHRVRHRDGRWWGAPRG